MRDFDLWVFRFCDNFGQVGEFRERNLVLVRSKGCRVDATELCSLHKPCSKAFGAGLVGPVGAHVTLLSHGLKCSVFGGVAEGGVSMTRSCQINLF